MRTVTVKGPKMAFPDRMKVIKTGNDVPVDYTALVNPVNAGRLAVDNELTRMKYCVQPSS